MNRIINNQLELKVLCDLSSLGRSAMSDRSSCPLSMASYCRLDLIWRSDPC